MWTSDPNPENFTNEALMRLGHAANLPIFGFAGAILPATAGQADLP
jgi:hypothetical protein